MCGFLLLGRGILLLVGPCRVGTGVGRGGGCTRSLALCRAVRWGFCCLEIIHAACAVYSILSLVQQWVRRV